MEAKNEYTETIYYENSVLINNKSTLWLTSLKFDLIPTARHIWNQRKN